MSPDASIDDSPVLSQGGRRSLTSLSQRMTANFCAGVCATGGHKWEVIGNAAETAKIMIRKSLNNPGEPSGSVLCATMSVWMPMPHQRLFALMLNEELRSQWDVLSPGSTMQNMIRFSKGQDPGNPNTISLLRANESVRHSETLDAINKHIDTGTYSEWGEKKIIEFLTKELKGKRPLVPLFIEVSSEVKEVLDTFRVSVELGSDSLGAYVISMASSVSW